MPDPTPPPTTDPATQDARLLERLTRIAAPYVARGAFGVLTLAVGAGWQRWGAMKTEIVSLRHDVDVAEVARKADHELLVSIQADLRALRRFARASGMAGEGEGAAPPAGGVP